MPDTLHLVDEDLPRRLAEAFARHPWVARVEKVVIGPGRQAEVRLIPREAVLGVRHAGKVRAVDRHGFLLRGDARVEGLPVYTGKAAAPAGPAGTPWGDDAVEEAEGLDEERHRVHGDARTEDGHDGEGEGIDGAGLLVEAHAEVFGYGAGL